MTIDEALQAQAILEMNGHLANIKIVPHHFMEWYLVTDDGTNIDSAEALKAFLEDPEICTVYQLV